MGAISIKEALNRLDPSDDTQWTHEGLPRMDVIERMVDTHAITRTDVTQADPEFCREVAASRKFKAETVNGANEEMETADGIEEQKDDPSNEEKGQQAETSQIDAAEEQTNEQSLPMQEGRQEGRQEKVAVSAEERLRDQISALDAEIAELGVERTKIEKLINTAQARRDALQQKTFQADTPAHDQIARMTFIKSQSKLRAERHERGRRIISIIGKDGLNPKSQLDQAMSRKTKRGTRRPPPRTPMQ
jgi:hypothetical protein